MRFIKKITKMFSWNETVAISLISILGDPELVIVFLSDS